VVIVDDASPDDSSPDGPAAALERLSATARIRILALRQDRNAGPAAARNRGWRAGHGALVAFTDDDCTPTPGWLAALVAGFADADVVQGRTAPDPAQVHNHGPFSRTLDVAGPNGFFQTCNVGYRRADLESVGGFDESFRHPMGEDTELAWRVIGTGARTGFAPDALVHHDVRPSSLVTSLRDMGRWESVVLTARRYPPVRQFLHSRWFWKASHPPALLALAGLMLLLGSRGRARIGAAALLGPYVRHRLLVTPLPGTRRRARVTLLPAALVHDLAEVAVLAAASVRYRRLLL